MSATRKPSRQGSFGRGSVDRKLPGAAGREARLSAANANVAGSLDTGSLDKTPPAPATIPPGMAGHDAPTKPTPPPIGAGEKAASPLLDQEEGLNPPRTQTPWLCGAVSQGEQPATKAKYHRQRAGLIPINRESYQFYVLPVATLLGMEEWAPHQVLLDQGKLVKGDEVESEIIFITHQWTSFDHPDPSKEQLRALQTNIERLARGGECVFGSPFGKVIRHP